MANFVAFGLLSYFVSPPEHGMPVAALQGLGIVSTVAAAAYVTMMAVYYARALASQVELEAVMRHQRTTAQHLRIAAVEADRASKAKAEFLAKMSHELRTPLNAVIGYAELIEEESERGPIAEDATKIRTSARQLLGVIDVILDISKLETGAIELRRERGPVSAVLQQLREAALPLAMANNNTVIVGESGALGEAEIDHMRLHQSLMQLVSNAAKFTHGGEIRIAARRDALGPRERLVFSVSDTGPGISPEDQARIFEPFAQGEDSPRRNGGAGLGLTLVRRLARLMGGDVRCESAPEKGATFTLWIDAGVGR